MVEWSRAKLMTSGVEAELSAVIEVFFPTAGVSAVARAFASRFPMTRLRLFIEGLGAAYEPVLDGRCSLGILPPLPQGFPTLASERLGELPLIAVASACHPLARWGSRIPRDELARHVQLVLTDRSELTEGRDFAVASPLTWRLADLSTKHAFLKDCVGWGGMPPHMVENDLAAGTLVVLDVDEMPPAEFMLTMSAFHRPSKPPGPAGLWFIDHLKTLWPRDTGPQAAPEPARLQIAKR